MQSFRRRPGSPATVIGLATTILTAVLIVGVLGCDAGPGGQSSSAGRARAGDESERFQFVRASRFLLRLDTEIGQLWFSAQSGDGGWAPLGDAPGAAGAASHPGRFRAFNLEAPKRTSGEGRARVLRLDSETGRTWTIELVDGASWVGIDEPDGPVLGGEPAPAPVVGSTPPAEFSPAASGEPQSADELGVVSSDDIAADQAGAADFAKNLVQALEKDGIPPDIKAWSARQLGQFPKEVAVPPLLDALNSEHPVVVVAAIHSLKQTGDPTTIPRILSLRDHPDATVRAAVQEIVQEVE